MPKRDVIKIKGARVHNLKNISLDIPKNKLVVIAGVSGSGKSSLAFDTLYAEGQRRYVESLSSYARQFLGVMQKPDVDKIEGISPAISIDQRKASHNPRSTVGTMTEIYDYLRVMFSRVGTPHCPKCGRVVSSQTVDQIVKQIKAKLKNKEVLILGPVVRGRKGEHKSVLMEVERAGFVRVRIDDVVMRLSEAQTMELDPNKKHNIDVVVDRIIIDKDLDRSRLVDSIEIALRLGKGQVSANDLLFSEKFACEYCDISLPPIEPRLFSFNSPYGACPTCQGLGKKLVVSPELVIPNKNLTIAEGAIFPWAHASHKVGRQGWFWKLLQDAASANGFSLYTPVKDLTKADIDVILYGNRGTSPEREERAEGFEGVVPSLERRYWQTDSDSVRDEIKKYMYTVECETCYGKRLKIEALGVLINEKSISDIVEMGMTEAKEFFEKLPPHLKKDELKIGQPLIKEIINRLGFLLDVGLDYLTLSRETETLSGGEEQRVRLATQIGSKLTGVLYILDEPSVGLHPRDQDRLIKTLKQLRDVGNSVIVVEHDPSTIAAADWIIDIGPGAGKHGGNVVFEGTPKQLLRSACLTGKYISGRKKVECQSKPVFADVEKPKYLVIKGAQEHNLKNIDVKIPLGMLVCVAGVSGSGKSSLVNDILSRALYQKFYRSKQKPGKHKEIQGTQHLDKVVLVDQSPIGRTPRSNPATYAGAFTYIREMFAVTKEAKMRGYRAGRFSFNVKGGRCEACEGQGTKKIEMYFLPDVYVLCEECKGARYNQETLEIEYKGKNIAEVLQMTVEEAMEFFRTIPTLHNKLKTLNEVGLGYIELGQPAPSLSGGEAQRVKLATELSKKATSHTMYILDEPTTGLHPEDINKLLFVLRGLANKGNTVLVIEHNIDVIRNSDWVIELGPDGGDKGGYIVVEGTPDTVAKSKTSHTAKYLR